MNKDIEAECRRLYLSGVRYGKTRAEAIQLCIHVIRGGYTKDKPLKVIEVTRYDIYREKAEARVARLKEAIKEISPLALECMTFEIRTPWKVKPKPFVWHMIEDYVDLPEEGESEDKENGRYI